LRMSDGGEWEKNCSTDENGYEKTASHDQLLLPDVVMRGKNQCCSTKISQPC